MVAIKFEKSPNRGPVLRELVMITVLIGTPFLIRKLGHRHTIHANELLQYQNYTGMVIINLGRG